ncbi:MAG: CDP-alcohol phosphatidyltransferase family protein [Acidobacteria bacterium]|nr:CDP-alcohol phosphatidyltransferase family protein [Acidobacteriota bacterium]
MTIANVLSGSRLVIAPLLLFAAWSGYTRLFLSSLVIALATDAVDGWVSRRLNQTSELGTKLDSWGDLALCFCVPLGVWWLWPDLVRRESLFVMAVLASYTIPGLFGLIKYRRIPSYHTRIAKIAAVLMGPSALILFLGGPAWPFHLSTLVVIVEALEEIAMTALLPRWRSNVSGLAAALAIRSE